MVCYVICFGCLFCVVLFGFYLFVTYFLLCFVYLWFADCCDCAFYV